MLPGQTPRRSQATPPYFDCATLQEKDRALLQGRMRTTRCRHIAYGPRTPKADQHCNGERGTVRRRPEKPQLMPPSSAKQKPRMFFEIVMAHKSNTLPLRVPYILLAFTNSAPLAVKVLPNRAARSQLGAIRSSRARKKVPYGTFSSLFGY